MPWRVFTLHGIRGTERQDFTHIVSPGPFLPYVQRFYAARGWNTDSFDAGPFQPDPPPDPPITVIVPGPPTR